MHALILEVISGRIFASLTCKLDLKLCLSYAFIHFVESYARIARTAHAVCAIRA